MNKSTVTKKAEFSLGGKEHQVNSKSIISIAGKLPYYLELRTSKIIDILWELFKDNSELSKNRKEARTKINNSLYSRTRPGLYLELGNKLHLAYAHQKDGRGTQHYWRLFFDDTYKNTIEKLANSNAIVMIKNHQSQQHQNPQAERRGFKEWGGMYFRSEAEIALAEALAEKGILFFANIQGLVNTANNPIAKQHSSGRLELDFLVFHLGKWISIEVDGIHHQQKGQINHDYARDRLLLTEGISTARFSAQDCYEQPELVVAEILKFF